MVLLQQPDGVFVTGIGLGVHQCRKNIFGASAQRLL